MIQAGSKKNFPCSYGVLQTVPELHIIQGKQAESTSITHSSPLGNMKQDAAWHNRDKSRTWVGDKMEARSAGKWSWLEKEIGMTSQKSGDWDWLSENGTGTKSEGWGKKRELGQLQVVRQRAKGVMLKENRQKSVPTRVHIPPTAWNGTQDPQVSLFFCCQQISMKHAGKICVTSSLELVQRMTTYYSLRCVK